MPVPLDDRGLPHGYPFLAGMEITPRDASRMLQDRGSGLVLLDCREQAEWEIARIAGSVHVPLGELPTRAPGLSIDARTPVAVICHHGVRSLRAAHWLRERGFGEARSVAGGIDLWSVAVDPAVPRY